MRFAHVFTVILANGGIVLLLLALFAGSSKRFLENAPIMTVSQLLSDVQNVPTQLSHR
jgi:hypothetical protein